MIRKAIILAAALLLLCACDGGGKIIQHETAIMTESGEAI